MFDYIKHGSISCHQYRGFYDAQPGSKNHCSFCNRRIRFCYALHDQNHKTFIIGSCDFYHYRSMPLFRELRAAQLLQRSYLRQSLLDESTYKVKAAQGAWRKSRRRAFFRLMKYKNGSLPDSLFELEKAVKLVPKAYKRNTLTMRWYENQAQKIETLLTDIR